MIISAEAVMENLLIAKPEPGAELRRKLIVRTLRSIPEYLTRWARHQIK